MVKRLTAVLSFLGLFVATVLFRGVLNITFDALGWVGLAVGLGIVALLVVMTLARKGSESAEPAEPPPPR